MELKNAKGLTLTELIIVSILTGIFMVGIVAFDYATRRAEESGSKVSLLAMNAATAMLQISRDAFQAIGSKDDPGIVLPDVNTTYIRQQDVTTGGLANNVWVLYEYDDSNYALYRCLSTNAGETCANNSPRETILQDVVQASFNFVASSQSFFLEVTIKTRGDPTAPADSMKNPEYTLFTRNNLPGHTW